MIHLCKAIYNTKHEPSRDDELWVILTCPGKLISCSKCTTGVQAVQSEGDCQYGGAEGKWEITLLPAQFFCDPRTSLKNKSY